MDVEHRVGIVVADVGMAYVASTSSIMKSNI